MYCIQIYVQKLEEIFALSYNPMMASILSPLTYTVHLISDFSESYLSVHIAKR